MKTNNIKVKIMKKEYDFSKAERGKFYKNNLTLNLPVYLDKENKKFFEKVAKENKSDLSTVVNKILKENIKLAQVLK
jgi:hypothetical protein